VSFSSYYELALLNNCFRRGKRPRPDKVENKYQTWSTCCAVDQGSRKLIGRLRPTRVLASRRIKESCQLWSNNVFSGRLPKTQLCKHHVLGDSRY
jgi:hypothetical protein